MSVLGCGRIGAMHASNIARHPRTRLVSVLDAHETAARAVADVQGARIADRVEDVLADPEVDAVLIATPTDTHADYIEKAVAAGKAVLCEKPIDLDLGRVDACLARLTGSTIPVQIGFNRRFDPGHRAARQAVSDGEIGALHQVIITSRDPGMPPRAYYESAGGLLRDMTIHDFDLARYMLDDEPVEVFAVLGGLIDPPLMTELGDHDTAMIILRTADGKQCHINNSRTAVYGYDQRVELLGSAGMVQSGNRKAHEVQRFTADTTEAAAPYQHFFIDRYAEAFLAELTAFADCVENGAPPEAGLRDGRQALALAEAAYLSSTENRMVNVAEVGQRRPSP